jgi:hypothetical protein
MTIDWVKDQDRANKTPSIADLDEESCLSAIESAKREVIREEAKENAETLAGKLTGENFWDKWKAGLENQLSMLYGPLVYVIREIEEPEEAKIHANFTQECIEK